tara:strand:- start:97 stop:567 length:471 start_codon:yes stop_codon:yes gene_type:complete
MINNFQEFLTYENIYLVANLGIIPFWLLLIIAPGHMLTKFLTQSIIPALLLAFAYIYLGYNIFLSGNIFDGFNLYYGINELYAVFSDEAFLLIFWLHFLSISLFVGSWIASDSIKYMVPRFFTVISLITTYFSGPVGLVIYWLIRIFFAKKINFNE